MCKKKKRTYKSNVIEKLDNLARNDPSEHWEFVKEIKDDSNADVPSHKISPDTWIPHLSNLFSVKKKFQKLDMEFTKHMQNLKKS